MYSSVLMVSLIVAFVAPGSGADEKIDVQIEQSTSMEACAAKRIEKIAALRAGPTAKDFRSYQILCITVQGNEANKLTMGYRTPKGDSGTFVLRWDPGGG